MKAQYYPVANRPFYSFMELLLLGQFLQRVEAEADRTLAPKRRWRFRQ